MIPAADRFAGFIVGQCLGDALGFLVEGEAPHICARYADEIVRAGRVPDGSRDGYRFGQYSDESQMARELMQSYAACAAFDPADYARRIAALFADGRIIGRGHATEQAARRLVAGVPWRQAGTPAPAAGNAGAMRAGLLGLVYGDTPVTLKRAACDQAMITHADPRCLAGAVAAAGAVGLAARDTAPDGPTFLVPLRRWTCEIEPLVSTALRHLEELLTAPPNKAAEAIARLGLPPGVDSQWRGGISAFVVASVLWALYAFLKEPDDFILAVALAIEVGGDVDGTAAMAGGLVGARHGLRAIPRPLAAHLNDHGQWGYDDLVRLAASCHGAARREQAGPSPEAPGSHRQS